MAAYSLHMLKANMMMSSAPRLFLEAGMLNDAVEVVVHKELPMRRG